MHWIQELPNWPKVIDGIEKGEKKIARSREIREALEKKVSRHRNPWQTLTLNYGPNKGKVSLLLSIVISIAL